MNKRSLQVVQELLSEYAELNDEIAELNDTLQKVKDRIFKYLEDNELETLEVGDEEDSVARVTIVRPTTLKIDEERLEEALTAKQWAQVTKMSVDKKALENAVVRGVIEASIVADVSTEVPTKPYLKVTRK